MSKTAAQSQFNSEHPEIGQLIDLNQPEATAEILRFYHANRTELAEKRMRTYEKAKDQLNWEAEKAESP